jgi:hypothetical protein
MRKIEIGDDGAGRGSNFVFTSDMAFTARGKLLRIPGAVTGKPQVAALAFEISRI